jgi:hypothetical protein
MTTIRNMLIAIAVSVALAASNGFAVELSTAPLSSYSTVTGTAFNCGIVNVSSTTGVVTIEIWSFDGTLRLNTTPGDLPPGQAKIVGVGGETGSFYCKFKFEGSKNLYRAAATITEFGVGTIAVAPAE